MLVKILLKLCLLLCQLAIPETCLLKGFVLLGQICLHSADLVVEIVVLCSYGINLALHLFTLLDFTGKLLKDDIDLLYLCLYVLVLLTENFIEIFDVSRLLVNKALKIGLFLLLLCTLTV